MKLFSSLCFERTYKSGTVDIKTITWSKDSYGLYDYES